jgi:hypothetical protein
LDFGPPAYQNTSSGSTYGTILFSTPYTYATTSQIQTNVEGFLDGFYSVNSRATLLRLGIGTNNSICPICANHSAVSAMSTTSAAAAHGAAWAQMINALNSYAATQGYYSVFVGGADDMEPGYNSPTNTDAWLFGDGLGQDGFLANTSSALYDFGSADGCPLSFSYNAPCGTAAYPWTQYQVWQIASDGGRISPVPEIYQTSMAKQWYAESEWSVYYEFSNIAFAGTVYGALPGQDLYCPTDAFTFFQNLLNQNASTQLAMQYSTQISYSGALSQCSAATHRRSQH